MSYNTKRKSNMVTDPKEIEYLLSITEEEGTKLSFVMECFGEFGDKRRFNPYDLFVVPAGSYGPEGKKNKKPFLTGVGIWVFNKVFIENELFDLFHYINEPVNKKIFKKINKNLTYAVIEDKVPLDVMKHYILKTQKFQPYCNILCSSLSEGMLTVSDTIKKKKEEIFKKYEKELQGDDPVVAQKVEKELLNAAEEALKDDPAMDLINSGAKISWGNNFKNMFIMQGAMKEPDPRYKAFSIMKSNLMDGVDREEYATFCNSLVMGPYSRAKKTEVGGAQEKLFVKALEHLVVLPEGTDCGTKKYVTVTLTGDNIDGWMYSYIIEPAGLVELNSDTRDKYIGKTVKMRFGGMCESKEGICSKCAGSLFNRIDIQNVGIASYQIPSTLKVKSMKMFHDSTVKTMYMGDYGWSKIWGL